MEEIDLNHTSQAEGGEDHEPSTESETEDEDQSVQPPPLDLTQATPDWSQAAVSTQHIWAYTSSSGDLCYLSDCNKHGPRIKCSACKILVHMNCLDALNVSCKATFRDVGPRQYREQVSDQHHWVQRRYEKGKCDFCGKAFQSKLSFSSKEIVAVSCSWCKSAFHNKESCFNTDRIPKTCSLGIHANIIVPPSWIIKLPRKGSFKSSLRTSNKKKLSNKKNVKNNSDKKRKVFVIKAIPTADVNPVIVFINPKSGGNQGAKLLKKFQWLLNPRQVFDLTQGGPKAGLELFRKVANLRILACGGDGTVGWVLSVLDQLDFYPPPAVGVLPLGTGNDLARALGWGGGYTEEPISKILTHIAHSKVVKLDRWQLNVEPNPAASEAEREKGKQQLPLNVVNNYFSLGVDAHIALEFHEAREAHPEKFNSRLRNKMFYGQMGGKDLLKRKWKRLADLVSLECDGKDYTAKLKELKVHAIVFLNIASYGGGTHPWPKTQGLEQSTDDGLIEIVGLTTYQLPLLQAGGHGTSICQCKSAVIKTTKTIPMQVDGEACKLSPSIITINLLNQANMLAKSKGGGHSQQPGLTSLTIPVKRISMSDYERWYHKKDLLCQSAVGLGEIEAMPDADLENVRQKVNDLLSQGPCDSDWCFVDTCTAQRCFRIDRNQENLHYLTDVAHDELYILETVIPVEGETAVPSPASRVSSQHSPASVGKQSSSRSPNKLSNDKRSEGEEVLRAAKWGQIKELKELHNRGYSLLATDSNGNTALHISAEHGQKEIVKYLIATAPHSILNMTDFKTEQTALHKATLNRHLSTACLLVAGGCSLLARDANGNTARDIALLVNDSQLATYLEVQEKFQKLATSYATALD